MNQVMTDHRHAPSAVECRCGVRLVWDDMDRATHNAWLQALDAAQPEKHEPGESHRYQIECSVCGQRGQVQLSVEPQAVPA